MNASIFSSYGLRGVLPLSSLLGFAAAAALPLVGCGAPVSEDDSELTGIAQLAISAAEGVASVSVDFVGATRTVSHCIAVDGDTVTRIERLPTGSVDIDAAAFASADCQGEATWRADAQTVDFVPGELTPVSIVFRPNGIALVDTEWVDDEAEQLPACGSSGWERVPREAMASDPGGPGGTGLFAVYDDGDTRYEGPIDFGPYEAGGSAPSFYPADVLADSTAPLLWQTIWGLGGETLTGYIVAPRTGTVSFLISADDYGLLELGPDGSLLEIEVPVGGVVSGTADLTAGTLYPVRLRYMNRGGSNWFRFYWACAQE
jgi:hypothetical protein